MIKNQIRKPADLSNESVFSIVEMHFAGYYKSLRISESKLNIRRLNKYHTANSREVAHKQMNFKDSGCFIIKENALVFRIKLGKQFIFWMILLVFGVFVTWKVWNATFLLSIFLVATPVLIVWIIGIIELNHFMLKEITHIANKLNQY